MRDVRGPLQEWVQKGLPVALATVIETWGSAPRRVGAKMAFTLAGQVAGSVSGGCVEGAVIESGLEVLATGRPRLLIFGVTDETAWEAGLPCGGSIRVFVEPLQPDHFWFLCDALDRDAPAGSLTIVDGPEGGVGRKLSFSPGAATPLVGDDLGAQAMAALRVSVEAGRPARLKLEAGSGESVDVFVDVIPSSPTLVLVGGVHIAQAMAQLAKALGYRTVVIDPRRIFGTRERFPDVDRLVQAWPDQAFSEFPLTAHSAVAILTHDSKIDDPALLAALRSPAFYIGALGGREAQVKRRQRLLAAGVSEEALARLHAPIGLPIGAESPEEIALSVMAEIVAAQKRYEQPAAVSLQRSAPPTRGGLKTES